MSRIINGAAAISNNHKEKSNGNKLLIALENKPADIIDADKKQMQAYEAAIYSRRPIADIITAE